VRSFQEISSQKTSRKGHNGSDGSTPETRMKRYGVFSGSWTYGENIAYGDTTGREIVCSLLIDDGVRDRGHRTNIMNKAFTQTGVGYGTHTQYRTTCTITYANGYSSNYPNSERPSIADNSSRNRSSSSKQTSPSYSPSNGYFDYFLFGYNYANGLSLGLTIGGSYLYSSVNIGGRDDSLGLEAEWIVGLSIPVGDFLLIPIGLGANHSGPDDERVHKFVMEIGLQPVLFDFIYLLGTYRLIGLKQSGFTVGAGIVLNW